jgi:hypothetical protein
MLDAVGNSQFVIPALFLVKILLSRIGHRQFMAGIDPRIVEFARLRERDPAAADRYVRELVEELRDKPLNEDVAARRGGNLLTSAGLLVDFLILGYLTVKVPAATLPALLATAFAGPEFWRSAIEPFDGAKLLLQEPDTRSIWRLPLQNTKPLFYGMAGGAIGYAALAALGIGVPAPDAALVWRIFGGLVFGAAIGIFSSIFLWSMAVSCRILRTPG